MRTIGQAFHLNGSEKCNNFLLIRLLAATLVLYGHSFVFSAKGATEFFSTKLGYHYAGDVGVNIFFVVSGFLVTASMCHRNNLIDFAISRALRIYPALLIFLFLTAILVGPFFSTVSLKEYFESNLIWTYFYNNITFTRYSGDLPIDFTGSDYPNVMAGILWTIVIEVRLYLLLGILGFAGILQMRFFANCVLVLILIAAFLSESSFLIFANQNNIRLSALFIIGSLIFINKDYIPLNTEMMVTLILITYLSDGGLYYYLFTASLIYSIFWFAFLPKIVTPAWVQDYSYGIYLYGWVVQQMVHYFLPSLGAYRALLIALPLTVVCAVLSWFFIEKPSLAIKSRAMSTVRKLLARKAQAERGGVS